MIWTCHQGHVNNLPPRMEKIITLLQSSTHQIVSSYEEIQDDVDIFNTNLIQFNFFQYHL